jgi:hypothetical protein
VGLSRDGGCDGRVGGLSMVDLRQEKGGSSLKKDRKISSQLARRGETESVSTQARNSVGGHLAPGRHLNI